MATVNDPPKSSSQAFVPQFSPRHLGYRLPAEWELHAATWLAWPHNLSTWDTDLDQVQAVFIQIIKAIANHETVYLVVPDEPTWAQAESRLKYADSSHNVVLQVISTDDAWIRDYGAMFVARVDDETSLPKRIGIDWGFNGWGKQARYESDNAIATRMVQVMGNQSIAGGMVLEGGSIDSNGQGILLATEASLLDTNKNANADRSWFEAKAQTMLGASQVIWLAHGTEGDLTGGRVDQVARFAGPNRIALVDDVDPSSRNYEALQENRRRVAETTNYEGRHFEVVTLPAPVRVERDGQDLWGSYANFYVANSCVLVPQYGHAADQTAVATIQCLFPGRKVIGIDCRTLLRPQGSLHALTQQVPAV